MKKTREEVSIRDPRNDLLVNDPLYKNLSNFEREEIESYFACILSYLKYRGLFYPNLRSVTKTKKKRAGKNYKRKWKGGNPKTLGNVIDDLKKILPDSIFPPKKSYFENIDFLLKNNQWSALRSKIKRTRDYISKKNLCVHTDDPANFYEIKEINDVLILAQEALMLFELHTKDDFKKTQEKRKTKKLIQAKVKLLLKNRSFPDKKNSSEEFSNLLEERSFCHIHRAVLKIKYSILKQLDTPE